MLRRNVIIRRIVADLTFFTFFVEDSVLWIDAREVSPHRYNIYPIMTIPLDEIPKARKWLKSNEGILSIPPKPFNILDIFVVTKTIKLTT